MLARGARNRRLRWGIERSNVHCTAGRAPGHRKTACASIYLDLKFS
jgi:hypothetical protein